MHQDERTQHDVHLDERLRTTREQKLVAAEQARWRRRLAAAGPGTQVETELGCVIDWAPTVGTPEWHDWTAA